MIAITLALPSESRDFVWFLGDSYREFAILHTGVGEKTCRARIGPFLDSHRFEFLISGGFAGSVDHSLGVGDLLLAENFSAPELLSRARTVLVCRVGKLVTATG
jgi:nucleoside phosphorylase